MSIKINTLTLWFFGLCFFSMAIPYMFDLGQGNTFVNDFYAKRIMTLFALPFFAFIATISILKKAKATFSKKIILYLVFFLSVITISLINKNNVVLIGTDAFIATLPIFFYLLVFKTKYDLKCFEKNFNIFLVMAALLVSVGVKLQFSYFSLLSIIYLVFLLRWNTPMVVLLLFFPLLLIESLIGKTALIMLVFLIAYFLMFDNLLVSQKKKIFLVLIPSVILVGLTIIFWSKIQETGSYRNFVYFLSNTDFSSFTFKDNSTSHRLFEAQSVIQEFKSGNLITKFFGKGFGATIDLSATPDVTIAKANDDITKVRNIHMGVFAVLYRYGIIGLIVYMSFMWNMLLVCKKTLRYEKQHAIVLSSLYIIIIMFDSLISFPHMMSNFLFWLLVFVVLKSYQNSNSIRKGFLINGESNL